MTLEELEVGDTYRVSSSLGRGSIWKVTPETMGDYNLIAEGVYGKSKGARQMMGIYVVVDLCPVPVQEGIKK